MKRAAAAALVAAAAALLFFFVKGAEYPLLIVFAAAIHEAGHIIAAKLLRVPLAEGRAALFGFSLRFDFSGVTYLKEAAVSAAGALFNLTACAVSFAFPGKPGTHLIFFIFSNLSLALFNLLPVSPLDGAGIFRALLSLVIPSDIAQRVVSWISASVGIAFFVFCVYVQMKIGANLSLMLISVVLLYSSYREIKGRS